MLNETERRQENVGRLNSNPATPTNRNAVTTGIPKHTRKTAPLTAPNLLMNKRGELIDMPVIKDEGKRCYVEYGERIGSISKRHRVYGQANRIKDIDARRARLEKIKNDIIEQFYKALDKKKFTKNVPVQVALSHAVQSKTHLEATSKKFYNSVVTKAKRFFGDVYGGIPVREIERAHIEEYLAHCLLKGNSARTRNNDFLALRTLFETLLNEGIIERNPCKGIRLLHTKSETHIAYTDAQLIKIRNWLLENDPYTYLFCQFIGLVFLRPSENRKLKVGDIDYDTGLLTVRGNVSKTQKNIKRIPKRLLKVLIRSGVRNYPPHYFLFTRWQVPGEQKIGANYFGKRFRKLKTAIGISSQHTMYGLRHSYVSQMVRNGAPWHEVMKQTGHTTLASFAKYMRSLGAEEPKDLSEFISVKF